MAKLRVMRTFNISGVGTVVAFEVLEGTVKPGMSGKSASGKDFVAKTMEINRQRVQEASPGDNIGIAVDLPSSEFKEGDEIEMA